eukprot:767597-Hanusia_phi.AAC.11
MSDRTGQSDSFRPLRDVDTAKAMGSRLNHVSPPCCKTFQRLKVASTQLEIFVDSFCTREISQKDQCNRQRGEYCISNDSIGQDRSWKLEATHVSNISIAKQNAARNKSQDANEDMTNAKKPNKKSSNKVEQVRSTRIVAIGAPGRLGREQRAKSDVQTARGVGTESNEIFWPSM